MLHDQGAPRDPWHFVYLAYEFLHKIALVRCVHAYVGHRDLGTVFQHSAKKQILCSVQVHFDCAGSHEVRLAEFSSSWFA